MMDHLWSPWRMSYIENHKPDHRCVFCHALECEDGLENLVIHRGRYAYVILNRYPYTSGHLMVVPFEHQSNLEDLQPVVRAEIIELVSLCLQILGEIYRPQGFNLGANIGSAAGAGIPKHFHFHIVPRWDGDTNFMSAVGDTRVVPEAIEESYRRIQEAWSARSRPG
jgi:ATP adenylyltransferase